MEQFLEMFDLIQGVRWEVVENEQNIMDCLFCELLKDIFTCFHSDGTVKKVCLWYQMEHFQGNVKRGRGGDMVCGMKMHRLWGTSNKQDFRSLEFEPPGSCSVRISGSHASCCVC